MAIPKVFVSSTCYDLQEERAQLERFICGYGFQPVLSEYNGVYYDIDVHTHESCINEVAHCDMFVLIISGRYGGKFKGGNGESITQAEYNKARELGLPIFTFVKSDVHAAQHYYKENLRAHNKGFAEKISYPAIQSQSDAVSIFNFIESVRRASTNNGIETYQSFTDIEHHLKKQWAGLFFSFLQKRKEKDTASTIAGAIERLLGSTSTLESLVESLHDSNVGADKTKQLIHNSEVRQATYKFFSTLYNRLGETINTVEFPDNEGDSPSLHQAPLVIDNKDLNTLAGKKILEDCIQYIDSLPLFSTTRLDYDGLNNEYIRVSYQNSDTDAILASNEQAALKYYFETGVKNSTKIMRLEVLNDVFSKHIYIDL